MTNERPLFFGTEGTLVGIVSEPDAASSNGFAAILVNAGVVHRVGPNRLYVTAARDLARQGFVSVRFDLPGIGDSPARRDAKPFEQAAVEEVRQVMSQLQDRYGVDRFVLIGLCSGAAVSFNTANVDDRIAGAVLINPQGFGGSPELISYVTERGQARRHVSKVFRLASWRRALTGQSNYRQWFSLFAKGVAMSRPPAKVAEVASGLAGEFHGLSSRGVRLLLACSGGDYSIEYLEAILGPAFRGIDRRTLHVQGLPAGDHSLTLTVSQRMFMEALRHWAAALVSAGAQPAAAAHLPGRAAYQVAGVAAGGSK